ncbi:MAG: lipopolysaccharide biosynthesis protein [Nitrospinales bacterium]
MKSFSSGKALRERMIHAGFWSISLHGFSRLLGILRTIIVAKLLAPDDIGLFTLAVLTLLFVETFLKTGFDSALVQRQGNIAHDLNVAWTVHVILGFIRASLLFFIAPTIAALFDEPMVKSLVQVVAFGMICHGFMNAGVIYLKKELEFHKEFLLLLSKVLADLCVSVAAAVHLRSAWALIYGLLAGYVVQVFVSYKIHPFRPQFSFDLKVFHQLFTYGKWMNLTGIATYMGTYFASVTIGKIMNVYALGIYQLTYWIVQAALVELAAAIGVVAFPAFSHIKNDQKRLQQAFIKTTGFTISVLIPITAILSLTSPEFVSIFLGEKWMEMIPLLKLLSVAGCFHAIAITGIPIFLSLGKPSILFQMQSLRAASLLIFIYPLVHNFGIKGVAWAMIISSFIMFIFWVFKITRVLFLSLKDFFEIICPTLIANSVLIILLIFTPYLLSFINEVIGFVGILVASVIVYILMLYLIQPFFSTNQPLNVFNKK